MNSGGGHKIIVGIIAVSILLSATALYIKYMVLHDYEIFYEETPLEEELEMGAEGDTESVPEPLPPEEGEEQPAQGEAVDVEETLIP